VTRGRKRAIVGSLGAGLLFFAAAAVWIGFQQGVGAVSYLDCRRAGLPWGALAGAAAMLACAAVAGRCWAVRAQGSDARRFVLVVAAGSAAIFFLAALTMTTAIIVVPACVR
jgi:hypothetical protein